MNLPSITPGQRRVLVAITALSKALGYPPTIREICDELDLGGFNGVHEHLRKLEALGLIRRTPVVARSTVVTELGRQVLADKQKAVA